MVVACGFICTHYLAHIDTSMFPPRLLQFLGTISNLNFMNILSTLLMATVRLLQSDWRIISLNSRNVYIVGLLDRNWWVELYDVSIEWYDVTIAVITFKIQPSKEIWSMHCALWIIESSWFILQCRSDDHSQLGNAKMLYATVHLTCIQIHMFFTHFVLIVF